MSVQTTLKCWCLWRQVLAQTCPRKNCPNIFLQRTQDLRHREEGGGEVWTSGTSRMEVRRANSRQGTDTIFILKLVFVKMQLFNYQRKRIINRK